MNLNALEREETYVIPKSVLDQPAIDGSLSPTEVGPFTGTIDAMKDIVPAAILSTTSSMYGAVGGLWEKQIAAAAAEAEDQGLPVSKDLTANIHDRLEGEAREMRRRVREEYTPSPETTGVVGQVMHGIGVELFKATAASATALGNPAAGALLYGAEHGISRAQNLRDAGVDEETAADAGVAAFVVGTVGMRLPATFGRSRLQSAIFGAVVNPAANVSEDMAVKWALQSGNAYAEAAKIDAFDPVNLAIAAVVGGGFGTLGWRRTAAQEAQARRTTDQRLAAQEGPRDQRTGTEQALEAARTRSEAPSADQSRSALTETSDVASVREASQRRLAEEDVGISARQNRNRNTAASIAQMASIAGNPDYQRLSASRVFADGAPAIGFVHDLPPEQLGRTEIVSASDGSHFEMRYAVMEARDIQYSNRVDGSRVEGFEDVKKNVAIAGNGRVAGLEAAYERGNADGYKAAMMADDYHGISAGVIQKMDRPILVRIMQDKDAARPDIAMLSNRSGTLALSATEQAQNDAAAIDVSALTFGEEGEITDETIRQFAALVPDNAALVDRNGVPNTMARPRLERAIFQRAYGNANLTSLLTDADGVGGRVVSVLLRTAPKMMQLEDTGDLDFRKPLVDAVNEIYVARASGSGMSIREIAATQSIGRTPETQAFLDYFATIGNNVKGPAEVFTKLADWAIINKLNQEGMFASEAPEATRVDLMQQFQELTGVQVDPHVLDMIGAQVTRADAAQKVLSTLRTQLSEAGFPEDQVEAQAQLWSGAVMRMADLSGRDPLDLLPKIKMGSGERPDGFEQIAYHGTPHVFDTFSTDAIGTGEGAQAHGWGLYFTQNREVAQGYRDRLLAADTDGEELMPYKQEYAETKREEFDQLLQKLDPEDPDDSSVIQTIEALRDEDTDIIEMYDTVQDPDDVADFDNRAIQYVEEAFSYSLSRQSGGRVFEVDIPENRSLLDEQKRLSEQPAIVREAAVKLVPSLARFLTNPADVTYQSIRSRGLSVAKNAYQFESALRNALDFAEANYVALSASHDLLPGEWDVVSRLAQSMRRDGDFRSLIASMSPSYSEEDLTNALRAMASYGDAIEYRMARNILDRLASDVDKRRSASDGEPTGRMLYELIGMRLGGDQAASLALKNLGVEGITYMGGTDGRCFVVFDDNAVKVMNYWGDNGGQIIGVPQSADTRAGSDSFYQLSTDELVTVHNISQDNLLKVRDLGGLAVPSLGITRADTAYTDFGDVTLIGTRQMIDPETGVPVFSQDAYTNRFPSFTWEKSVNKRVAEALTRKIDAWSSQYQEFNSESATYYVFNQPDPERFKSAFARDSVSMQAFLGEKGIRVDPVYDVPESLSPLESMLKENFWSIFDGDPAGFKARMTQAYVEAVDRLGDQANRFQRKRAERYRQGELMDDSLLANLVQKLSSKQIDSPRINNGRTVQAIETALAPYADEYRVWVDQQTKGVFEDPKIKVGNSYLPVTLENVVRAMTKRTVRNQESTLGFGPGKVRAAASRRFRTLQEIRDSRGRIAPTQEVQAQNQSIDAQMANFRDKVSSLNSSGDLFTTMRAGDSAMEALADSVKGRAAPTAAKVKAALQKAGLETNDEINSLGAEILTAVRNSMTDYFEAKPQRGVRLNEFAGAVVPENVSPEVVKALEDAGLEVRAYAEGQRQAAVSELSRDLQAKRGDVLYQSDTAGAYTPSENTIRLTPNADITTFSHEMGHWWLNNLMELTKSKETDLSLRKDARIILDHFGIKDQAEWDALGVEGQRKYHEQFASYVEEYLTTGRAPTPQMRSLLEKFRQWIVGLYRDFRAHLNDRYRAQFGEDLPPLSEEVRSVLERNLVLDDALAASYKDIQPTHAVTDAARYRLFENTVRSDQPVQPENARDMQSSLFAESSAADAVDAGEKVSIQAPVDVDRVRGERDAMVENLGGQEAFRPVSQDTDMPVSRPEDTARPVEEMPSNSAVEEESPQDTLFGAIKRFFTGESNTTEADAGVQEAAQPLQPSLADARSDAARTQAQAEEILRRNPDLKIEADADDGTAGRSAQELIDSVNRETAESDRFADVLPEAAQCIIRNGGI